MSDFLDDSLKGCRKRLLFAVGIGLRMPWYDTKDSGYSCSQMVRKKRMHI